MGIKDWFGGDKKKSVYRDKVKEAVSDGKLSPADIQELKALREELDVTDAADDKTQLRREIYNEAVDAARSKGQLSATGFQDLAKIQKFLALRDDQIETAKWDVNRLRQLTEIKKGNLPVVPANNVALRGVVLEGEEIAHYSMTVDVLDQASARQSDGVRLDWGLPYAPGSALGHALPLDGAKEIGESNLILTNKRLVLKTGSRIAAVKFGKEAQIYLYSDGVRLPRAVGNTLLRFRSGSDHTAEIVGELLSQLMRPSDLSY
jgi:Chloroplast envelope transporter